MDSEAQKIVSEGRSVWDHVIKRQADSAMARAILKVYKSASRVPAAPSIDDALVNCVRNRITSFSEVVVTLEN